MQVMKCVCGWGWSWGGGTTRIPESASCLLTLVEHRYLVEDLESVCRFLDGVYQLMSRHCKVMCLLTNNSIGTAMRSTQGHHLVSSIAQHCSLRVSAG